MSPKELQPYVSPLDRAKLRQQREAEKQAARDKKAKAKARKPGSRFPKRRDPEFMAWLLEAIKAGEPLAQCVLAREGRHVCGFYPPRRIRVERAHVFGTRGAGSRDMGHVVCLCPLAHDEEQGETELFERAYSLDLQHEARLLATRFLETQG